MENLRHKKNTCEEKNIFPPKWLRKMHLKNVRFTYKSQILKFKIKQKIVFQKKCDMIRLNVLNFFIPTKNHF